MGKPQKESKSAVVAVEARKGAAVGKKKKVIDLSKQGSQGRSPRVLTAAADIEKIDNVCVCANGKKTQNGKNKKRELVFNRFGGRCAYSGKPLCDDWQIDHCKSKFLIENEEIEKMKQTKDYLDFTDFMKNNSEHSKTIDYAVMERIVDILFEEARYNAKQIYDKTENLFPALKIINHYKRELDIEGFRKYILTLHNRIEGLYCKTQGFENTVKCGQEKRLEYLLKVADCFGITRTKQFDGFFYFEKGGVK